MRYCMMHFMFFVPNYLVEHILKAKVFCLLNTICDLFFNNNRCYVAQKITYNHFKKIT